MPPAVDVQVFLSIAWLLSSHLYLLLSASLLNAWYGQCCCLCHCRVDWAGGLMWPFYRGFLFTVTLFKGSSFPVLCILAQKSTEVAQVRRQLIIIGSSDTKRNACGSSSFSHCQWVYGAKSPFLGAKHWRHTPLFTAIVCCLQLGKCLLQANSRTESFSPTCLWCR